MSYAEKIKAKIKEIDLETQLSGLVDEGEKLVQGSVTKAGDIAHDKRDDVAGWLDKASTVVNEKTDAKYADKVSKVRDTLLSGVDKVAARRAGASEEPSAPVEPAEIEVAHVEPNQPETDTPDQE